MKYEGELDDTVVKLVRSLPTYAGVSFDQRDGGRPTVRLTQLDSTTVAAIRELDPDPSRGLRVVEVKHSYDTLVAAAEKGEAAAKEIDPDIPLSGVGVDVLGNGIQVFVPLDFVVDAEIETRLKERLGVPVTLAREEPGHDTACTSRTNCANPIMAGIRIDRDFYPNANWWCTLGWVVSTSGGDEQLLTSGHCGWGNPRDWHHGTVLSPISNEIGDDPNGTLYRQDGKDIMRGSLSDAQASRQIYAEGSVMLMRESATPIVGQAIVFSGARTNALITGTVQTDWRWWTSETAGFRVWGGDASWTTEKGDSGAPVYRRVFVTSPIPGWQITPIGSNSHQNGFFARVFDAQTAWNLTMYNQ
jgi:hypothetical protein